MSEGRKHVSGEISQSTAITVPAQTGMLLSQLTQVMKRNGLWASLPPSEQALASTAPFACDSMAFEQWVQFIFIPKMRHLLEQELPLPVNIAILPMAEEMLKGKEGAAQVCAVIGKIDQLLSGQM